MSVAITSRPSTWSAVKNPTVYKIRRYNNIYAQVNDNGGFMQFQFDGVDSSAFYVVGHFIHVSDGNFTAEVTASAFSGGNTLVTVDTVYAAGLTTGHITNISVRTDGRVEVELFNAVNDESLSDGVVFTFTPRYWNGGDGICYCDVSTIVKAYLSPDWIEPTALNEVEDDTSLEVYIKYQEIYTGSATSVNSDSANPVHCVFGGLQIPSPAGNDLDAYVPEDDEKKFLTIFDRPKLWRDYPSTLSIIFPDALALTLFRTQYDAAGALLSADRDDLDTDNDEAVNRLDLFSGITLSDSAKTMDVQLKVSSAGTEVLSNPGFDATIDPWTSEDPPTGTAWTAIGGPPTNRITVNTQASESIQQDITEQAAGYYYLAWKIDTHLTDQGTLTIEVWNDGVLAQTILDIETPINVDTTTLYTSLVNITDVFDEIRAYITYTDGTNRPFNIGEISLKSEVLTDYSHELTFDVEDPCENPVLLFWKNSLGGDSFWLFEHGQEAGYTFSGSKKAKRMTLFAENLTLNQWEALNELNTIGEIYTENIQEFTSSVNKSHVRDGAQVYLVDSDGDKTGVIVIPTQSIINTKHTTHRIEIEIEFPERYE